MMYSFRKSFFPTPEEEAEMCRAAIKLHEEQIGDCSTCVNLDRSTEPGFVTDYGGCRMGKAFFAEKACGLVDHVCDGYTEERGWWSGRGRVWQSLHNAGEKLEAAGRGAEETI